MITPIYATLLSLLYVGLSVRTLLLRRKLKIGIGTGDSEEMLRAVRAHSNFAEYVPIALLLALINKKGTDLFSSYNKKGTDLFSSYNSPVITALRLTMRKILLFIFFLSIKSHACVSFHFDVDWDQAESVFLGKVISGRVKTIDGYEYAQYKVEVSHVLKNSKVKRKQTVHTSTGFPTLAIGNRYIVFKNKNGYVDYCGSTQYFSLDWLLPDYEPTDNEPQDLIKKVKLIVNNAP